MNKYLNTLESEFSKEANGKIALEQKAYMRNQFEFLGIKTPIRRKIQKAFLVKKYLPPKSDLEQIIRTLWLKPEREYQYYAQELAQKYVKQLEIEDIELFEFMITTKSWWDTIDIIAVKLVGEYLKEYPEQINKIITKWIISENMWLQRTAILFQLQYRNDLDTELLSVIINKLKGTDEFFINKAIGWVLRQYSRTNPEWVISFVEKTELDKLSRKEALRLLKPR